MKQIHPVVLLLLVVACKSEVKMPANNWMIGSTPEQVRNYMLGKPGKRLEYDKTYSDYREMSFGVDDYSATLTFLFQNGRLKSREIKLNGVHSSDMDREYGVYKNLGRNDWLDTARGGRVYLHREYNGGDTYVTIKASHDD